MPIPQSVLRRAIAVLVALVSIALFSSTVTPTAWAAQAAEKPGPRKAVLLFSYHKEFWAVADEGRGVVEGLAAAGFEEGGGIEITRLYMDTKTVNKTTEQMERVSEGLLKRIKAIGPDILFIMDDDALRHVGAKLLDTKLPIVFAGVNFLVTEPDYGWLDAKRRVPLADSLERPGHNITGVQEKTALLAGLKLLHQILPQAKTALFLSDNSYAGTLFLRVAGGEEELDKGPFRIVNKVYTDSFETFKAAILDHQDKVDCIVVFLPWTLEDAAGKPVPQQDAVRWMLMHNKRPGVAYLDVLAEEGYLCGVVVDMVRQGFFAGTMGARILKGEKASELPIVDPVANKIVLNLARAGQLGIDIPFEVLKSADVVHKAMTAYPEFKLKE